jgi:hypothetical protein
MNRNNNPTIDSWLPCAAWYDDDYRPESAPALFAGLKGVDDQSLAVALRVRAEEVAAGLWEERN